MITQDYLNLQKELAFPSGCTFSAEEIKRIHTVNPETYVVFVGDDDVEGQEWQAESKKALLKALRATYLEGTEVDIVKRTSKALGTFKL